MNEKIVKKIFIKSSNGADQERKIGADAEDIFVHYENGEIIDDVDGATGVVETHPLSEVLREGVVKIATPQKAGVVKPDGTTITIDQDGTIHGANTYELPMASPSVLGGVKVDGSTITINPDGVIKSAVGEKATTTKLGTVKPDGSTITIDSEGVIKTTIDASLSLTSNNPVANKAVKAELNKMAYLEGNNIKNVAGEIVYPNTKANTTYMQDGISVENKIRGFSLTYDEDSVLSLKTGEDILSSVTIEGGGSKSILTLSVDDELLYERPVTVVLSGGESLRSNFSSGGVAVFNLKFIGTYTVTCDGYTTTVENTALGSVLEKTLHVAKSVITVNTTTPEWFSDTVVLTKNNIQEASKPMVGGTVSFKVYETGTYTVALNGKSTDIGVDVLDENHSVTLNGLEIVAFSSGTDKQILAMINAYYDGTLSLEEVKAVWTVGDTRNINLASMAATGVSESHRAQTVQVSILDFNHDTLTSAINGKTKALITLGQKHCLMDSSNASNPIYGGSNSENGYMNSSNTNGGGWNGCARRKWCNNIYYNAIPADYKNAIKSVNKLTSAGSQSSSIQTTSDKVFLLSEIEIFGSTTYSRAGEGTKYPYFNTAANRLKNPKWDSSRQSNIWWERSPLGSNSNYFCTVHPDGDASSVRASDTYGLAPAFCL